VADSRIGSENAGSLRAAVTAPPNGEVTRAFRDVGGDGGEIPRLLSSREEADAIMSVVPWRTGFKAVDFQANRATVLGTDLGQYRIVHFATHALLDNEHPELSGIVLSLVDQKGERQDGFLRLHDIYNLKLPVDLVVLSACQTGLGKDVKGEGLIGLTRGFMYAGASGVVASLWKVDDEATAELMKHFYTGLFDKGLSPAAALREAQLSLRKQKRWHEPYYWAGFVIQGRYDGKESAGYRSGPLVKVAAVGVLAGTVLFAAFIVIRRRRKGIL
jgi:CHAT domain-containing protein